MSYKILLADDSVTVQKIITLTFSDEGVDVVTVNNGDEAINRLQYMRPALVMADVSIPGRNGYEICEFVKSHPEMSDTPVILLVPAFEPFDEDRARRIGADYHLTKPFQSIRTLISTVKSLIERQAPTEFSVAGSGLTAIQGPDHAVLEPAEIDPKRAKIDELIRLSAQPALEDRRENMLEDEVLTEIDLTQSESEQAEQLSIADIGDELDVIETSQEAAIEDRRAQVTNGPAAIDFQASAEAFAEAADNVLELDDIFSEASPAPPSVDQPLDVLTGDEAGLARVDEKKEIVSIPQSIIDQIVSQVVAQLSEKLTSELARRLAPEIAELIKQQQLADRAAFPDSDNLLDID